MQLRELSLFVPKIEAGTILKALETAIPASAIEQALKDTKASEDRKRALPSHLVVCLIIAMSLWSKTSMRGVLKNLVDGVSEAWVKVGSYWQVPSKSSITEARQRIGAQVMCRLFHLVVRPLATVKTPGAFLGGLRIMAIDGSVFDIPDSAENARVFGYPGSRPGTKASFPKARLVIVVEAGTHLIIDALIVEVHRGSKKRWEVETTIDELKVHLLGRKTLIRSLNPREVVQEVYGWLLGHWAIRSLMFQVAEQADISPLRLSFTGTLNIVRRAVPKFQRLELTDIPFF